jgi:hypothetical protein
LLSCARDRLTAQGTRIPAAMYLIIPRFQISGNLN